jgi:hypothetical protein
MIKIVGHYNIKIVQYSSHNKFELIQGQLSARTGKISGREGNPGFLDMVPSWIANSVVPPVGGKL